MVPDMAENTRVNFAQRFAATISRQEEDVRDWTNGAGQLWLGGILLICAIGFIFFGFIA